MGPAPSDGFSHSPPPAHHGRCGQQWRECALRRKREARCSTGSLNSRELHCSQRRQVALPLGSVLSPQHEHRPTGGSPVALGLPFLYRGTARCSQSLARRGASLPKAGPVDEPVRLEFHRRCLLRCPRRGATRITLCCDPLPFRNLREARSRCSCSTLTWSGYVRSARFLPEGCVACAAGSRRESSGLGAAVRRPDCSAA